MTISPMLLEAIETNIAAFFGGFGQALGDLHEDDELTWFQSGVPLPLLNGVLRTGCSADCADQHIERLVAHFAGLGLPFTWWTNPLTEPSDLPERLAHHGFTPAGAYATLAFDLVQTALPEPDVAGLEIHEATGAAAMDQWTAVFRVAFPVSVIGALIERGIYAKVARHHASRWTHLLGVVDGAPVATTLLLPAAGVAGIYAVSTVPAARRQGVGTAMTLAALRRARALNYRFGILYAAEPVAELYRRIGFRDAGVLLGFRYVMIDLEETVMSLPGVPLDGSF